MTVKKLLWFALGYSLAQPFYGGAYDLGDLGVILLIPLAAVLGDPR